MKENFCHWFPSILVILWWHPIFIISMFIFCPSYCTLVNFEAGHCSICDNQQSYLSQKHVISSLVTIEMSVYQSLSGLTSDSVIWHISMAILSVWLLFVVSRLDEWINDGFFLKIIWFYLEKCASWFVSMIFDAFIALIFNCFWLTLRM